MKTKKIITSVCTAAVFASLICMPAYAASGTYLRLGNLADGIPIKVVDHVVFPAIDLILPCSFLETGNGIL